ncbi:hypothetical protein RRG08_056254 [Elysia crispata]|uniref:Dermatopontin n=1 Tax=Elysia crispata TaxID=231223 RepID=A0AAE1AXQ6_9GAST|nr:hypothetical protein RRG08_056254 [Elysia crispata]
MKCPRPLFLRLPVAAVIVALMILPVLIVGQGFHSDWDQPFLFECPLGQTLKNIFSVHDNRREDRRWRFGCANGPGGSLVGECFWTGYVNGWDAPMNFVCPVNHVISGLQSYHDNGKEDRRFKFKCCHHAGYITYSCSLTGYINSWDGVLNYNVPSGHILAGVASIHDNYREDRLYQVFICLYGRKIVAV